MASVLAPEAPQSTDAGQAKKKKTRLNPARRKAAKLRIGSATDASSGISEPIQNLQESLKQDVTETTKPQVVRITTPRERQTLPSSLARQKSDPLIGGKKLSTTSPKPTLLRTTTAPASAPNNKSKALALTGPAVVAGGLVGCAAGAAILLGVGLWYDFAGAESALLAAKAARLCVDNLSGELVTSLKAGTYSADEALDMLRRTTLAYASTIPEGAPFVERVFREIDMVRKQRGREIDKVVAETYMELAKAGTRGASSAEMRTIVVRQLMKLSTFASKATQDVVARNPKLRPFQEGAAKAVQGPKETGVPTLLVNMAVRQKGSS